jgi:uncharacterized protein (DUF362 family)
MKSTVSIVRCKDIHSLQDIEEALRKSLDLIGGLEAIICPKDTVIVKPNLIKPAHYRTGIITNSLLIKALCKLSREKGARRIIIGEGSAVGYDTEKAFDEAGMREIAREMEVELVDFKKAEWISLPIPAGKVFHRLKVPRILMEADVVINVPVMKTHDALPATLGLKNMKGVIQEQDKKRFHRWGLSQAIVDLNKLVLPELTIIDGTVGMEGLGPTHGTPVNLGILIASRDTVAADVVAALVMGIDPLTIEHIKLAAEEGLGWGRLSQIETVGESLEKVKRPFQQIRINFDAYREREIFIQEDSACSGCRHLMEVLISNLEKEGRLDLLKGYHLLFGQLVHLPSKLKGKLVNIGVCTKKYKNLGDYIPGCPPHPKDIVSFFEEKRG